MPVRGLQPLILLALTLQLAAAPARAQQPPVPDPAPVQSGRLYIPVETGVDEALRRIEALTEREQWDRVVYELDRLLEQGDRLVEVRGRFMNVRDLALSRIAALSGEALESYRLTHDLPAERLLDQARGREAGVDELEELVGLHSGARCAGEARLELAARYLERGEPGAALEQVAALRATRGLRPEQLRSVACLESLALLSAGRAGAARTTLEGLAEPEPLLARALEAAGSSGESYVELFPAGAKVDQRVWARETYGYYEEGGQPPALPAEPQTDGGRLYVHDGTHAQALDLETGKLVWRVALRGEEAYEPLPAAPGAGHLALSGSAVLCQLTGPAGLVALDRATGRVRWRRTRAELAKWAEVDYLVSLEGRPCLVGRLAVTTLVALGPERQVYVLALDLETGEPRWKVFLASQSQGRPPQPVLAAGDRRVFCVTGLGAVAALDIRGGISWLRKYDSQRDDQPARPRNPFGLPGGPRSQGKPERVPSAVVSQGILWACPADSDRLLAWATGDGEGPLADRALEGSRARLLAALEDGGPSGVLALGQEGLWRVRRGERRSLGKLPSDLVAEPRYSGGVVYLPRAEGVFRCDVRGPTLQQTRLLGWGSELKPGPVLAVRGRAAGRLVVASADGVQAFAATPIAPPAGELEEQLPALVAALGADAFARRELAQAALIARGEPARAALDAARADSPEAEVRLRARIALAELDRKVRIERWTPLVKQDWLGVVPYALERLTHPNGRVRLEALEALGQIKDDPDVLVLLNDLLQDQDMSVATVAAASLLGRGDRAGVELLARSLRESPAVERRLYALAAFAEHGQAQDLERIRPALEDEDPLVRAPAIAAALELGGEAILEELTELLEDDDKQVRLAVLEAFVGDMTKAAPGPQLPPGVVIPGFRPPSEVEPGPPLKGAALQVVARCADDEDDEIRALAVDLLVVRGGRGPEVYRALAKRIGDESQQIAQKALGKVYSVVQDRDVGYFSPETIERASAQAAKAGDDQRLLNISQIAIYLAHGGDDDRGGALLTVATLCRFLGSEYAQIRTRRLVTRMSDGRILRDTTWRSALLERVRQARLSPADLGQLIDLTTSEEPQARRVAFEALANAVIVPPGRSAALVAGLLDKRREVRERVKELLEDPPPGIELLNTESAARLLSFSLRDPSQRPEAVPAKQLLERIEPARLLPLLTPALRQGYPQEVRQAVGRKLEELTEGRVSFDPEGDLEAQADAFQVHAWKQLHPDRDPRDLVAALTAKNPSRRWRAAQEAPQLPSRAVRNTLIMSLSQERVAWVQEAKLAAAAELVGTDFGYRKGQAPAERRKVIAAFQTWLSQQILRESVR